MGSTPSNLKSMNECLILEDVTRNEEHPRHECGNSRTVSYRPYQLLISAL